MPPGVKITPVGPALKLGEGPHWEPKANVLYYVDVSCGMLNRYDPAKNEHTSVKIKGEPVTIRTAKTNIAIGADGKTAEVRLGENEENQSVDLETGESTWTGHHVSIIIPVKGREGNEFVIATGFDIKHIVWDQKINDITSEKVLINLEENRGDSLLNDGKVDPAGRLWIGSLRFHQKDGSSPSARLYSLEKGSDKRIQLSEVSGSNGLTWSLDHKKFYYVDTFKFKIFAYDYDKNAGTIDNERTILDFKESKLEGAPDGMTIDSEGKLWVAIYSGSKVLRFDPDTGKILYELIMPVPEVTSVAFGGPNLDELYVTTGRLIKDNTFEKYPDMGKTFRVTNLGFKGTPMLPAKLT